MSAEPTADRQLSHLTKGTRSPYSHITEKQSRNPSEAILADKCAPVPICMVATDQINLMSMLGWDRGGSYMESPKLPLGPDRTAHASWFTKVSGSRILRNRTMEVVTRLDVSKGTREGGIYDDFYSLRYRKYDKNGEVIDSFDTGVGYAGRPIGNPTIRLDANGIAYNHWISNEHSYCLPNSIAEDTRTERGSNTGRSAQKSGSCRRTGRRGVEG
jgi:hypothetical protein